MKLEALTIKNYKVFRNVTLTDVPNMAVFVGRNGAGKTAFFDVFGFLHDCLMRNVTTAVQHRGGFKEILSRGQRGDVFFKLQFRPGKDEPLITYEISIGEDAEGLVIVKSEILRMRRGQQGAPWKILDFANGEGVAADGELKTYQDVKLATRKRQKLGSPDILAIKGLGQFRDFVAVNQFRKLIEDWFVADLRIDDARERQDATYNERLNRSGNNLAVAAKYIHDKYPQRFEEIIGKMKSRVPGIDNVEAKVTEDGYIVLRFQDGGFANPFSAKFVSDGTIKMFAYLVLLGDPEKHALLCVEEPENQLYPELLEELAEEFRQYGREGQVFVSTHSPDFLNAAELEEIFVLVKQDGFTQIKRVAHIELVKNLIEGGEKPGEIWKQGLLAEEG